MAKMCLSHKLAFSFGLLLVVLAVHSNIQVMAMRVLPLEIQMIEQFLIPDLTSLKGRCFSPCKSSAECNVQKMCSQCRKSMRWRSSKSCMAPN